MAERARDRGRRRLSMRGRTIAGLVAIGILATGCAEASSTALDRSATSPAGGLVSIGAGMRGASALKATLYATGLVNASALAFDARGRLWVATSAATDHKQDAVYLVATGAAAPIEVVSDVEGPLGLLWIRGTLFVASIGRVDAYTGFDSHRFAHHRTVLNGPLAGAANAGLVLAPNGRILMSVATRCDHCTPTSAWAATIVSFRQDGSDLRIYATGVRDAFGLAFAPGTAELFATLNQRDDLGSETPGDLVSTVDEGDDLGFPDCYGQGGAACAGVPAPVAELDRHAGAGGIVIVSGRLGGSFGTSAIVAEWATGKVVRVALTGSGSAIRGTVSTFLTGMKNPLPVALSTDGHVLVGDWTTGRIVEIAPA
jgi:glucose/arabinose dehydrogenase